MRASVEAGIAYHRNLALSTDNGSPACVFALLPRVSMSTYRRADTGTRALLGTHAGVPRAWSSTTQAWTRVKDIRRGVM